MINGQINQPITPEELAELKEHIDSISKQGAIRLVSEVERLRKQSECSHRVFNDQLRAYKMLSDYVAKVEAENNNLQTWKTLIENAGDVARDRFIASQYCAVAVESWRQEVAKKDAEIERLQRKADRRLKHIELMKQTIKSRKEWILHLQRSPLRQEIARLQAEAAAYRQAMIETCRDHCEGYGSPGCRDAINEPCKERKALDSSTAGAELLNRLNMLETLFSKAQVVKLKGGGGFIGILANDVIAALDGKDW